MNRLRRLLQKFKKPVTIIAITTVLLTTTAAVTPPKAEASALLPFGCGLLLESPSNPIYLTWCAIAIAIDCCDPTGDSWLD